MEQLDLCYKEIAEELIQKYKVTRLQVLQVASIDKRKYLGFPLPWSLKKHQKYRCYDLGANDEDINGGIFKWILAFMFPEFQMDMDFLVYFYQNHIFWGLNLKYYQKKQRTIFEDYMLPHFDWDAWGDAFIKVLKARCLKVVDEELRLEEKRQNLLLRAYDKKIMQIAMNAVAYLE